MRFTFLIYLLSIGLLSCSENGPTIITNRCRATQQYAKTVSQATGRLVGSWTLLDIITLSTSSPAVKQTVQFDSTGHCLITQDGQQYGPYLYSIDSTTSFLDQTLTVPRLTVFDSTQLLKLLRINVGQLYVCEQELVIDYGGNLKSALRTYQRQ